MKRWIEWLVHRLASLRILLIISFILMMAIAGFLGYILTNIQAQKSMNELTELSMTDIAYGVVIFVQSKINIGHQLNQMESLYFLHRRQTLAEWPVIYHLWRPLVINAMYPVSDLFYGSGVYLSSGSGMAVSIPLNSILLINFNNTVCHDVVNFPGSNCSVHDMEGYPYDPFTFTPMWNKPLYLNVPFPFKDQQFWRTALPERINMTTWRSSPEDPFSLGYSAIAPNYAATVVPMLNLNINAAVLDSDGRAVGLLGKGLSLNFLSSHLQQITSSHKLLIQNGRAFCFELSQKSNYLLLTGASHGGVSILTKAGLLDRFDAEHSPDKIISSAGSALRPFLKGPSTPVIQVRASAIGNDFTCLAQPLTDQYGLCWMVTVVVSLTELFRDVNQAASRMLIITAVTIVVLSLVTSLGITLLVTRPLVRLSWEMEAVSLMDLEVINLNERSLFFEIATMQSFFHRMIANLKEYRAFLPQAILATVPNPSPESVMDRLMHKSSAHHLQNSRHSPDQKQQHPSTTRILPDEELNSTTNDNPVFGFRTSDLPGIGPGDSVLAHTGLSRIISTDITTDKLTVVGSLALSGGSLSTRRISVALLDVKSFYAFMRNTDLMVWVQSSLTHVVMKAVQEHRGTYCPPMGDKIMALWNVRIHRTDHATLCVNTAIRVQHLLNELRNRTPSLVGFPDVAIACTSGLSTFGAMGTRSARSFTTVSPCITRGSVLTKLAGVLSCQILCDWGIYQPTRHGAVYRLVAILPSSLGNSASPSPNHNFHCHPVVMTTRASQEDTQAHPAVAPNENIYEVVSADQSGGFEEWTSL